MLRIAQTSVNNEDERIATFALPRKPRMSDARPHRATCVDHSTGLPWWRTQSRQCSLSKEAGRHTAVPIVHKAEHNPGRVVSSICPLNPQTFPVGLQSRRSKSSLSPSPVAALLPVRVVPPQSCSRWVPPARRRRLLYRSSQRGLQNPYLRSCLVDTNPPRVFRVSGQATMALEPRGRSGTTGQGRSYSSSAACVMGKRRPQGGCLLPTRAGAPPSGNRQLPRR
jgi:hypothetical protein